MDQTYNTIFIFESNRWWGRDSIKQEYLMDQSYNTKFIFETNWCKGRVTSSTKLTTLDLQKNIIGAEEATAVRMRWLHINLCIRYYS